MSPSAPQHVQNVLDKLQKVKAYGSGWTAQCPAHADRSASLSVRIGKKGEAALHCFAGCTWPNIVAAVGLQPRDLYPPREGQSTSESGQSKKTLEATYRYVDASGDLVKEVRRYRVRDTGAKDFRQVRFDDQGRELWSMAAGEYYLTKYGSWVHDPANAPVDAQRRHFPACENVLYNLPAVLAAAKAGRMIVNPEGEKDCGNVTALGFVATTNAQGAHSQWLSSYTQSLAGASLVVVLADNDQNGGGMRFAEGKASSLHSAAIPVKVLKFEQKDVSDYLAAGGTKEALLAMIEAAPLWTPPPFPAYETEEEWKVAGKIAAQACHAATAVKTKTTIALGMWMASLVKERGFEYGSKIRTAKEMLGPLFSSARRAETVVTKFHEAGILASAKFERPFDLYLNVAKAPVEKRAALLERVDGYQKGLTGSAIVDELRASGDLPAKKKRPDPEQVERILTILNDRWQEEEDRWRALHPDQDPAPRQTAEEYIEFLESAWAPIGKMNISPRIAHEIVRLGGEKGEPAVNALLERSLGLKSNNVRYTDLPGSALKEDDPDLPPGIDDIDNHPHILYMQREIRDLKSQLSAAKIRHFGAEEEIVELRRNNQVLADLAREALRYMPAESQFGALDKLNASVASEPMDLDFAQLEQSEDDAPEFAQVEQSASTAQESEALVPACAADVPQSAADPPDRPQLARAAWPDLVAAIEARAVPGVPFSLPHPEGGRWEEASLRYTAGRVLEDFITLDGFTEEEASSRMNAIADVYRSLISAEGGA